MFAIMRKQYKPGDSKLISDLFVIINAGSLTTSHALTGSIFYANKYPEKAAPVIEEINRVVGNRQLEDLSLGELHDMEKLSCFLKETLRVGLPLQGASLYFAKN